MQAEVSLQRPQQLVTGQYPSETNPVRAKAPYHFN
jgi:hypothetical protein